MSITTLTLWLLCRDVYTAIPTVAPQPPRFLRLCIIYNIFLSALIYLFILDISFYFIEWKNEQAANSITIKVVLEVGVYSQEWEP